MKAHDSNVPRNRTNKTTISSERDKLPAELRREEIHREELLREDMLRYQEEARRATRTDYPQAPLTGYGVDPAIAERELLRYGAGRDYIPQAALQSQDPYASLQSQSPRSREQRRSNGTAC